MSNTSQQIAKDLLAMIGNNSSSPNSSTRASLYSAGRNTLAMPSTASVPGSFLSEIESAILRSTETPIHLEETEELTVLGERGIWANKSEVMNWRGTMPICEYPINEDTNPEIINKKISQQLEYVQELAVRYLRPPTPPAPGEIVITQEPNTLTPPAPPLVIRQQPPRPETPEPLIIREAPPQPPPAIGRKLITISGKKLPPPARKVVIERLAPIPSKPQSVIVERWLPYNDNIKRRVVFQKAPADPVVVTPRNVIVQWEAPNVSVKQDLKFLGIVRANPVEYVQRFGPSLKVSKDLPQFVSDIKCPEGIQLAAQHKYKGVHELEGDIEALKLVDLDKEGLSEYKDYLQRLFGSVRSSRDDTLSSKASSPQPETLSTVENAIEEAFKAVADSTGSIDISEASRVVSKLNNRLSRNFGEKDVHSFYQALNVKSDRLSMDDFKKAYYNV